MTLDSVCGLRFVWFHFVLFQIHLFLQSILFLFFCLLFVFCVLHFFLQLRFIVQSRFKRVTSASLLKCAQLVREIQIHKHTWVYEIRNFKCLLRAFMLLISNSVYILFRNTFSFVSVFLVSFVIFTR